MVLAQEGEGRGAARRRHGRRRRQIRGPRDALPELQSAPAPATPLGTSRRTSPGRAGKYGSRFPGTEQRVPEPAHCRRARQATFAKSNAAFVNHRGHADDRPPLQRTLCQITFNKTKSKKKTTRPKLWVDTSVKTKTYFLYIL